MQAGRVLVVQLASERDRAKRQRDMVSARLKASLNPTIGYPVYKSLKFSLIHRILQRLAVLNTFDNSGCSHA